MSETEPHLCMDCGVRYTYGLRCRWCHGKYLRNTALAETATRDRELLAMLHQPGGTPLSAQRLSERLGGISRTRVLQKIRKARAREAARAALGIGGETEVTEP